MPAAAPAAAFGLAGQLCPAVPVVVAADGVAGGAGDERWDHAHCLEAAVLALPPAEWEQQGLRVEKQKDVVEQAECLEMRGGVAELQGCRIKRRRGVGVLQGCCCVGVVVSVVEEKLWRGVGGQGLGVLA